MPLKRLLRTKLFTNLIQFNQHAPGALWVQKRHFLPPPISRGCSSMSLAHALSGRSGLCNILNFKTDMVYALRLVFREILPHRHCLPWVEQVRCGFLRPEKSSDHLLLFNCVLLLQVLILTDRDKFSNFLQYLSQQFQCD